MKTYHQWKIDAGVNPESKFASICEADYNEIQRDATHEAEKYIAQLESQIKPYQPIPPGHPDNPMLA